MKWCCAFLNFHKVDNGLAVSKVDTTYGECGGLNDFFELLTSQKIDKVFMADTSLQFSHILAYATREKIAVKNIIKHSGKIYSFTINKVAFVSCDNIYGVPFWDICREFELGKPSAAAIEKLVYIIEDLGESKFSFIKGDFLTIGALSWKWMSLGFTKDDAFYEKYNKYVNETEWEALRQSGVYRGGLCLVNGNFVNKDIDTVYKYDKNSFFLWVMVTGNMPSGRCICHKGKPNSLRDKMLHIKVSGFTKYPGLAALPLHAFGNEDFFDEEVWIWGDELEELMNWYDMTIEWIEWKEWQWNSPDNTFRAFAKHFFPQKKAADGIRRRGVKLIINNSYGKWGQRPYYSTLSLINGEMTQSKERYAFYNKRSLAVASKITALARTELLRSIRTACRNQPDKYFVYGDTDSMILTIPCLTIGDGLGQFKFEGEFQKCRVLDKKCYLLYEEEKNKYEAHAAGVNRKSLEAALRGKSWEEATQLFDYDVEFECPVIVPTPNGNYRTFQKRKIAENKGTFDVISGSYILEEEGD